MRSTGGVVSAALEMREADVADEVRDAVEQANDDCKVEDPSSGPLIENRGPVVVVWIARRGGVG